MKFAGAIFFLLSTTTQLAYAETVAEGSLETPPNVEISAEEKPIIANITNMNEAVEYALEHNPAIQQAEKELEAVAENESQAIANFLPQISADFQYGRQRNAIGGSSFEYSDVNTKSLSISQAIWAGGRNLSTYDTAILEIELYRIRLEEAKQRIALETRLSYIDLLFDKHLLKLATKNEKLHKEHLNITKDRFELGELSHTDFSQSSTRHTLALSNKIDAENQLNISKYALEKLLLRDFSSDELNTKTELPEIPETLEKAQERTLENNLTLKQSKIEFELAQENIDATVADILPTLSLQASMNREEESGILAQEFDTDSVALRLSVPIFDGGANYSRVSQARRSGQAKEFEIIDRKREIIRGLKSIWKYIETSEQSLSLAMSAIKSSERALEGTEAEEQIGVRTVLDVLNSEQERINAITNLVQVRREQLKNYYRLLDICGLKSN